MIFLPALFASQSRVSLRIVALDIPPQDVITRDNVSVKVNAVLYMRVTDPAKAVIEIEDYLYATSQLAQTTLRSVLGEVELDELLSDREKINAVLKKIIDERTEAWGIEVSAVEVKDVDLPDQMKRAMARQAEAERERRAKVIAAQGELQASETLAQAARTLATEPSAIQLRYLQTVTEIAAENNSTTIFPIPIELFRPFLQPAAARPAAGTGDEPPGKALPAADLSALMSQLRLTPRRNAPAGLGWPRARRPGSTGPRWSGSSSGPRSCRPRSGRSGDSLTPDEVLALGKEVGIPEPLPPAGAAGGADPLAGRPRAGRWSGPSAPPPSGPTGGPGEPAPVEEALIRWIEEHELFCVQRHQPGRITWEPLAGFHAAFRRSTGGFSGRQAADHAGRGRHRIRHRHGPGDRATPRRAGSRGPEGPHRIAWWGAPRWSGGGVLTSGLLLVMGALPCPHSIPVPVGLGLGYARAQALRTGGHADPGSAGARRSTTWSRRPGARGASAAASAGTDRSPGRRGARGSALKS